MPSTSLGRFRRRPSELGRARPHDTLENPGDDERAVNARDDLDGPAAALADGHIDFEHPGQASATPEKHSRSPCLRPPISRVAARPRAIYRHSSLCGSLDDFLIADLAAFDGTHFEPDRS